MADKKVYLAMCADMIHHGHLNIIKQATKLGKVTVGVLTDQAIASYKRLPFLNFEHRKIIVENLKGVENVIAQDTLDYRKNLCKIKPNYVVNGDDWREGVQKQTRQDVIDCLAEWEGELIEIPYTKGISSTILHEQMKQIGTTPNIRLNRLRRLINAKPIVRLMESHSALTGLIIEHTFVTKNEQKVEFDGMWSSSLTDSTLRGKPDIEAVNITSRLKSLDDILECTTKPIIYDGDTGGKIEHFPFTVKTLERNGISAIIIEDKIGLKKNSLFGQEVEQQQDSIENFCVKLKTGKSAQITDCFMIIARIESFILGKDVNDALLRAEAYVKAGADGIMIHSKDKTGNDIKQFCQQFRKTNKNTPLIIAPTSYNMITEDEFINWGINIVIYANHMLRSSYPAMKHVVEKILEFGRSDVVDQNCMSIKEILELIPGTK